MPARSRQPSDRPPCAPPVPSERNPERKTWQKGLRDSSSFLSFGVQLAGSMLVYIFIGYFLDRWLETAPWLMLAGAVLGMAAFFIQLFRLVGKLDAGTKHYVPPDREAGDDAGGEEDEGAPE